MQNIIFSLFSYHFPPLFLLSLYVIYNYYYRYFLLIYHEDTYAKSLLFYLLFHLVYFFIGKVEIFRNTHTHNCPLIIF